MRKTALYLALLSLACTVARAEEAAPTTAKGWQDYLSLTLSDRMRGELVDWFEPRPGDAPHNAHHYGFFANQLRFGVRMEVPHLLFFVEGQDTRLLGLPNQGSPPVSKVGNLGPGAIYYANTHDPNQGEVFLKEGYFTLRDLPSLTGVSLTGGRFEYSDGLETIPKDAALAWLKRARIGERLVGPFSYTHVTRSFDGVRGVYDNPDFNVTLIGTRPTDGGFEVSANRELDAWLAGLAFTLKQIENFVPVDARAFYLYYRDNRDQAVKVDNRSLSTIANNSPAKDTDPISIHTIGTHAITVVDAGPGKVDGLVWAAMQWGDWGKLEHLAWAYAVETGYQFPQLFAAPWLRAGYNRSSGDDNPNDQTHETFFQLLPTARIYAQFPFYNMMNTEDLFGQLVLRPHQIVTIRTDYHWLRLTNATDLWYSGGGATNDTFFGFAGLKPGGHHELAHLVDVAMTFAILKQLSAYAYYGRAFGQSVVGNSFGGRDANYGYVEVTLRY